MRVLVLIAVAAATMSCGSDKSPTTPGSGNTVDVATFGETFLPTSVNISAGDNVRWTFSTAADGHGHNVLFQPKVAGAPADITNELFSGQRTLTFNSKGTFNYICALHGAMTGTVIVQ